MKTTILSIAAASVITLASAGAATAAGPVANPGLFDGGSAAKVETVHYRGGRHFHRGHGRGIRHRVRCRRLYYRGYVLGHPFARRMFNRFCTYRFGYRYGGYRNF
jgi:hypothetical protein